MRYVVLIAIALLSALITGSVSPQLPILGAEPDILLIAMLCMELREKTVTPVIACSVAALFTDAFFAPALGYYSLPYAATGLIVYAVFRKLMINKFYGPMLICAVSWLFKDTFSAVLAFFLGNTFDFFYIFSHSTLPGILVNAVLTFPIFLLIDMLYRKNFMAPRLASIKEEFPEVGFRKQRR